MSDPNRKETVLITGASRGIGLALSREFARHGFDLVLVARDTQKLEALAGELKSYGVDVRGIALDLSRPDAPKALFDQCQNESLTIDMLINNAGIVSFGKFAETDLEQELQLIHLNMAVLTHLTKLFLQPMLARKRGRIVNISSLLGYQPGGPMWAVYAASKSYVLSFTKALSVELRGTGVGITALCPGATLTDFVGVNNLGNTATYKLFGMSADKVARLAYNGIMKGKTVVIPGFINKLLAFAGELPPRRIALEINALLMK